MSEFIWGEIEKHEKELLMLITQYVHAYFCFKIATDHFVKNEPFFLRGYFEPMYKFYSSNPVFSENVFAKHGFDVSGYYLNAIEELRACYEKNALESFIPFVLVTKKPRSL